MKTTEIFRVARFTIPHVKNHHLNNLASCLVGAAILLATSARAQNGPPRFDNRPAKVTRAARGERLTPPSQAAPASVVANFLKGRGASDVTLDSLSAVFENRVARTGITHLRMEQRFNGLTVHGTYVKAAVNNRGELVHLIENIAPAPAAAPTPATVSELQALSAAMARVHPGEQATFQARARNGNTATFAGGAFFHSDPTVTMVAVPMSDGSMAVGFLVETWSKQKNLLHHTLVSGDGRVLEVEVRTANDSYNVFIEDPSKGPQTIVSGPGAGNAESPNGWLNKGSQKTINISGNNVNAYLDAVSDNSPDSGGSPVSKGNFLTAANLATAPATTANRAVAVQNLFYLNNVIHDVLYRHGFDEAAGNFQFNNFGKGGGYYDPVLAEAQDGGGMDNANFATPPDGSRPRMQMYLWNGRPTHQVHLNSPGTADYGAMGAAFGPALTATGVTGDVVDIGGEGCEAFSVSVAGKIALIDRGTCPFTVKVLNAQNAGAVAVIVVNNVGTTETFTMGGTNSQIVIPSVMVGKDDGTTLRGLSGLNVTLRKLPTPLQKDGDLDSDIVFHEYGHGLTWRMIGGMSGPLAGAIGEGASDGLAMLMNGDPYMGEYSSSLPLGIRSSPYAGFPRTYGSIITGTEIHYAGEVYAAIIWRLMELFDQALIPRSVLMDYFVDGMNYTPVTPKFEDMRDGMLASVANGPSPEHCSLIWQAFAQFGVGVGASATVSGSTVTVIESFEVPASCP